MNHTKLEFNLENLLATFEELLPLTDEERGLYWFKTTREDGISITLSFSAYEKSATVIVRCNEQVVCASTDLDCCVHIRVLDRTKGCVELLGICEKEVITRCLICLFSETILQVEIPYVTNT